MRAVLVLVVAAMAVICFVVWSALYVANRSDERLELINANRLRERHENLKRKEDSQ